MNQSSLLPELSDSVLAGDDSATQQDRLKTRREVQSQIYALLCASSDPSGSKDPMLTLDATFLCHDALTNHLNMGHQEGNLPIIILKSFLHIFKAGEKAPELLTTALTEETLDVY